LIGFQTSEFNLPTLTIFHVTCLENLLDRAKTSIQNRIIGSPKRGMGHWARCSHPYGDMVMGIKLNSTAVLSVEADVLFKLTPKLHKLDKEQGICP
jgi:hypothetical protein